MAWVRPEIPGDVVRVQLSLLDGYHPLIAYCHSSERAESVPFVNACADALEPGPESLDDRWKLISVVPKADIDNKIAKEMAIAELSGPMSIFPPPMKEKLFSQEELSDTDVQQLCTLFIGLRGMNPGLLYTLLSVVPMDRMTIERAIGAIGPEVLSLLTEAPITFFEKWEADPGLLAASMQYPIIFESLELCTLLQNRTASAAKYPGTFLQSEDLPLVNTVLNQGKHMIDIHAKVVEDFFIVGEFECLPPNVRKFEELLPFFLVLHQPMLYANIDGAHKILNMEWTEERTASMVERMKNDLRLLENVSFITDSPDIPVSDLVKKSLPFMLQYSLGNAHVLEWADMKLFSISDNDRATDFAFLRGYRAMWQFLRCFKKPGKALRKTIEAIMALLDAIENRATQSYIVLDLFSCLFIKENDAYVCHPAVAVELVRGLAKYGVSPLITGAQAMFKAKKKLLGKTNITMDAFFTPDHGRIYQAVRDKKRDVANDLVKFLPYYKKFVDRAFMVDAVIANPGERNDCPPLEKAVRLDVIMSKMDHNLWNWAAESFPDQKEIIRRHESLGPRMVLGWSADMGKWRDLCATAIEIDTDPFVRVAGESHKRTYVTKMSNSKNLLQFMEALVMHFQGSSLGAGGESLEAMFDFDVKKAIAGPFNIRDHTKAQQLADFYGIDLFECVIVNKDLYQIEEEFIGGKFNEHPLECTMLAYTNKILNCLGADKMENGNEKLVNRILSINKPIEEKPNNPAKGLGRVIDLVTRKVIDDMDDYVFDCDAAELYSRLLRKHGTNYSDAMIYALDRCSYVGSSELDKRKEDHIRLMNRVFKLTQATQPTGIVTDLLAAGQFDMTIEYIKKCVSPDSWGSLICQIFQASVDNGDRLDFILHTFPEKYDMLRARFFHDPVVTPHLLKSCPPDRKDEIEALANLPEEIKLDSNIFDIATVVSAFARHTNCIYEITPKIARLFTESQLVSMIGYNDISRDFRALSAHISNLLTDKATVMNLWMKKLTERVIAVDIETPEQEEEQVAYFSRVRGMLSGFDDEEVEMLKVRSVCEFMGQRLCQRYGLRYSFADFDSADFPLRLIDVCDRYDIVDVVKSLARAFSVPLGDFSMRRIEMMSWLGRYDETKKFIESYRPVFVDDESPNDGFKDPWYQHVIPVYGVPVFERSCIEKLVDGIMAKETDLLPLYVYPGIRMAVGGCWMPDERRDEMARYLIGKAVSPTTAIANHANNGAFPEAFALLMGITDVPRRSEIFIRKFYAPAICRNFAGLESFLSKPGETQNRLRALCTALDRFCRERGMLETSYILSKTMNRYVDAALTALEMFDQKTEIASKLAHLGHCVYFLTVALEAQQNPLYTQSSGETVESLTEKYEMAQFLHSVVDFCVMNSVPFESEFNVMKRDRSVARLAAILVMYGETEMLQQLCGFPRVQSKELNEIAIQSAHCLSQLPIAQIQGALIAMKNGGLAMAGAIISELLKLLAQTTGRATIPAIINGCVSDPRERCGLLIEFDYLAEAVPIATKGGVKDLLPLIAHRASILGNRTVLQSCGRIRK